VSRLISILCEDTTLLCESDIALGFQPPKYVLRTA